MRNLKNLLFIKLNKNKNKKKIIKKSCCKATTFYADTKKIKENRQT